MLTQSFMSSTVRLRLARSVEKLRHVQNTIRMLPGYVWDKRDDELYVLLNDLESLEERISKLEDVCKPSSNLNVRLI